ncbi:MAG: endo-type 6-aminohexanoate oligomer hydrolase [uncultured Thermomicrobiales bacterium]|uniref:Endo-type 6-aminohexanoate oligomer hydrolase n=1 Tax=uncultured Thermomicrobiales bacterium TaxID=1645740 RepID=A0A6J4VPW8_9BACT|nr:MAG: endo-type 6-aminohexanoate oligomer hydrolase [uncultured Thermomicrobiales bacterium]
MRDAVIEREGGADEQGRPVDDVLVGHWTDTTNRTGCTVIVLPGSRPTVVDARGGAPGTRETDVLAVSNLVRRADAIVLSGGSAFGLATADGVMLALRERGRGFPTTGGPVPIVPAAVLFDLSAGNPVWPDAAAGRAALNAAVPIGLAERGRVGAGTGATVARLTGSPRPGGLGIATVSLGPGNVTAVMAVNAVGSVDGTDPRDSMLEAWSTDGPRMGIGENTTIGVVIVDAPVDHLALTRCAIAAHDGLARAIVPSHTIFDGDTIFVSGLQDGAPDAMAIARLGVATELAVERAVRDAVAQR